MTNLREVCKLLYFKDFNPHFVLDLLFGLYVYRHTDTYTDTHTHGFPDSSVGNKCNGSIPGSETSTGEGIGYPLQYSWAFFVASWVKNPPAMRKGSIARLGQSLWEGKGCILQYSGLKNSMDYIVHGVAKSQTWLSHFQFCVCVCVSVWVCIYIYK